MQWLVSEKPPTPPPPPPPHTEEISTGNFCRRGEKIVSDNCKCTRTSEGGSGVNFQFPLWGSYGCFVEWPNTILIVSIVMGRETKPMSGCISLNYHCLVYDQILARISLSHAVTFRTGCDMAPHQLSLTYWDRTKQCVLWTRDCHCSPSLPRAASQVEGPQNTLLSRGLSK
jgi:hypothetical protein